MKPEKPQKVFLDANVVIQAGQPPGGPVLDRLRDLVRAGFVSVLTTDVTMQEVSRHHAERDYGLAAVSGRSDFRRVIKEIFDVQLPETKPDDLKIQIRERCENLTKEMFNSLSAIHLSVDEIAASTVFDARHSGEGFFAGTAKKHQFPDAFVFERIKTEAKEDDTVVIVSDDADFEQPTAECAHLHLVKSIQKLFEFLGLQKDVPEIADFLQQEKSVVIALLEDELRDKAPYMTDINSAAEADNVKVRVLEIRGCDTSRMVSFRSIEDGAPVLATGEILLEVRALLTVGREEEAVKHHVSATIKADASISVSVDAENKPSKIELLQLRNDSFDVDGIDPIEAGGEI